MSLVKRLLNWRNPHNLTSLHLSRLVRQGKVRVGPYSYGAPKVRFADAHTLSIGSFCSFADNIQIFLGGNHDPHHVSTYPFHAFADLWPHSPPLPSNVRSKGDVVIGSDVWIGSHACLLSGITVGHGAIIGAYSVVSKDVPPYAVVAGNPARVVGMRFDVQTIEALLACAWWNLSPSRLQELLPLLASDNVQALIEAAKANR